jgi:hemoglobin
VPYAHEEVLSGARLTREIMARIGIDEVMIERLVRRFYRWMQADAILGSIFAERITDWHAHISKLCDFGHQLR